MVLIDECRVVIFGEVLFDRFPDGSEVLGGAPFNVAWNLRGLGEHPLLLSRVGQDDAGERILRCMCEFGLETGGVQMDSAYPTGAVVIRLVDGEPEFEIQADQAYDHIDAEELPSFTERVGRDPIFYQGTLALRSPASARAAEAARSRLARECGELAVFYDVNLRDPWWNPEMVEREMQRADHLKLNQDELTRLRPGSGEHGERARRLRGECQAEAVYLTRGEAGAVAVSARDGEAAVEPKGEVELIDPVGAGDAFASVLILGQLESWSLETTLERAQDFAAAVVGLRGATTTEASFYDHFRTLWSSG